MKEMLIFEVQAQMLEHCNGFTKVTGSNPVGDT